MGKLLVIKKKKRLTTKGQIAHMECINITKYKVKKHTQIHSSTQNWPLLHMDNLGAGHHSLSPLFIRN